MDEKICQERHTHIQERLDRNEKRLDDHSDRLDKIEQNVPRIEERMSGLILEMSRLNSILRWIFGLAVTTLVGFIFKLIEKAVM